MVKKLVVPLIFISFLFVSCTPVGKVGPVLTPADSPLASVIAPTFTITPPSGPGLNRLSALYTGPGNVDFEVAAVLPAGESVVPLAVYEDFIQVNVTAEGRERTGYLWAEAVDLLPAGLPSLTGDQVPWKMLYQPRCTVGNYDEERDQITFVNETDGWLDSESPGIPLEAPLKINIGGMSISGSATAAIKILGVPESSSGLWWQGITRMDLGYSNGHYSIGIRDGRSEGNAFYIELPLSTNQRIQILFDQPEGKSFHVLDGTGQELQFVDVTQRSDLKLPDGIFPKGEVYIGTSLPPRESLTVTGMQIGVSPSGQWLDIQNGYFIQPGLADLAALRGITTGTVIETWPITSNPRYCQIMKRDFSVAVVGEFSSKDLWIGPGQYDFGDLDRAVDFASQRGWRVRASHLLWGSPDVIPDWLKDSRYSRDEYIRIMQQYIQDIVGRYKGRVQEWSIANEAINRSTTPGADFWNDRIGPQYIAIAFNTARAVDPEGILIFNEDNNHSPQDAATTWVIDKMYAAVDQLKTDDVPIDVVGMEMHLFIPWGSQVRPEKDDVIATMQKFASLGVRIYITELDVDVAHQPGTQAEKWEFGAQVYADMMKACLESGVCGSFTTWGISDSTSWITCSTPPWCVNEPGGDPLMFDVNYDPKPAYFSVRDALLTDFFIAPTATPAK